MTTKNKELVEIKNYSLDKMDELKEMSIMLKDFIVKQNLYTPIMGKNYVNVEGWMFAGGLMGLFPRIVKVENISNGKWMAQAEIIDKKTGNVVGTGFAICSKEENKKASFDEYAILSMAQTRSISKAYRNLIGWVVKLAGYESTPAEEVKGKVSPATQTAPVIKPEAKVLELKLMLKGGTDTEKLADLKKRSGISLENFQITEKHAGILIAGLLNSEVKK